MIDMTYDSQMTVASIKASETSPIGTGNGVDAVHMLLAKLDEGTHTITNLRSILTLKTAELNELVSQLELTNQAITRVESTTTDIENMLKDFVLPSGDTNKESMLMNAEASLDLAIKSANSIYPQQFKQQSLIRRPSTASTNSGSNGMTDGTTETKRLSNARLFSTRIRYKPDTKQILRKLNDLLRDLELDSGKFFSKIGTTDDFEVLQKAYVDLDIAKTIALSAKSNMKRRNILARSARRRSNLDEIHLLGDKIREGVAHWMTCTNNAPLLVNGEDILVVLDREDNLLAKNLPIPSSRGGYDGKAPTSTPSSSTRTRSASIRHSFQNDTMEPASPMKRPSHSRSLSAVTAADFAATNSVPPVPPIPAVLPSSPVLNAVITNTASTTTATTTTKKLYRQSAGPRLTQVKANIGLPRVRTTSITQQKDQQQQHQKTLASAQLSRDTNKQTPSSASFTTTKQSHIPLPPSQQNSTSATTTGNATNNSASPDTVKKSLIKPPTQRGPGSTLRLRSMLARRGQAPTSLKPPTMKNNNPE